MDDIWKRPSNFITHSPTLLIFKYMDWHIIGWWYKDITHAGFLGHYCHTYSIVWWSLFSVMIMEVLPLVRHKPFWNKWSFLPIPSRSRASVPLCRVSNCNICVLWSKKLVTLYGSYWIWKRQSQPSFVGAMVILVAVMLYCWNLSPRAPFTCMDK